MALRARSLYSDGDSRASSPPPRGPVPAWKRLFFPANQPVTPIFETEFLRSCDALVYELLALICREHVLPWYARLTRDRTFLQEVARIVVHVIREVERRVARIDLAVVLASDLPALLQRHIEDARKAKSLHGTIHGGGLTEIQLFHSLQPHLGINLDEAGGKLGIVDAAYLSTLVESILQLALPPEDSAAETEKAIVREVVIYVMLAGVIGKVAQPWFVHQALVKELAKLRERPAKIESRSYWLIAATALFHAVSLLFAAFVFAVDSVAMSSWKEPPASVDLTRPSLDLVATALRARDRTVLGQVLWLAEATSTVFGGSCDGLVRSELSKHLLKSEMLETVLVAARDTLFPGGKAAPHVPDPTKAEQEELRAEVERSINAFLPDSALAMLLPFAAAQNRRAIIAADLLEPFDCYEMNVHLFMSIIDLFAARIFPELLVGG